MKIIYFKININLIIVTTFNIVKIHISQIYCFFIGNYYL